MREDAVSDKFFYRVIEIYNAAERDFLRDAFEGMKLKYPKPTVDLAQILQQYHAAVIEEKADGKAG